MWSLFRAEWKKTTGNRWLVGCLIGIFPIVAFLVSLGIILLVILHSDTRHRLADNPTNWTDVTLFFWAIPNSIIGRLLIIGFTAALFAGEYQWGTWKNLLPRRGRVSLILMKFLTLGVFVVIAFSLTTLIWLIGRGIAQLIAGGSYPPGLDNIPSSYWGQISLQIIVAFISALIMAGIAALVALLTRSILASVITGIAAALLDGFIGAALLILYAITDARFFPSLYRFTISYNVDNLLNWANDGNAAPVLSNVNLQGNSVVEALVIDPPLTGNSLLISLIILLTWMCLLVGLSVYSFYRQDITS